MAGLVKFLLLFPIVWLAACGDPPVDTSQLGPGSEPTKTVSQTPLQKYDSRRVDSLQKLQKDSFDHSKQVIVTPPSTKSLLFGKWRWDKSICCGRMAKVIVDTSKEKLTLDFKDGQIINYYRARRLVDTKSYRLGTMADHPSIHLEGNPHAAFLSIQADTLIINYAYIDQQTDYYIRVKE